MECVCQVCMDLFDDRLLGTECADGHFLCDECLNPYLTQNVFPNLYKLKRNNCSVPCPAINCSCTYSSVVLYEKMKDAEKIRYRGILESLSDTMPQLQKLKAAFLDILTLKCPTCHNPVDPYPDACSAIMCLNCGNWYCNCCFLGFSGGDTPEADRAGAHSHVASHHTRPDNRDAFLPPEIVAAGQQQLQQRLIVKCLSLAMTSKDFGGNGSSESGLGLILIATELADLNMNLVNVWNEAEAKITDTDEASGVTGQQAASQSSLPSLTRVDISDGGKQLAFALKTQNLLACRQIMQAFKDDLNCNYIDEDDSGHPLASLALLLRQKSIVVHLLRRGANPLLMSRKVPRTVLYVAIEIGMLDVVKLIIELNPTIDLNSPISDEENKYAPLHVAARYNHGHIVKFLASKGADINMKELELGYTPILLALVLKHSWAARELILLGCNLLESGTAGRTSLFILAEKGQVDLLSLALSDKENKEDRDGVKLVDVNAPVSFPNEMRLLHVAAYHNQPHVVTYLLSLGSRIDLNSSDEFGYTALGLAVLSKNIPCCQALLRAGADATQPCNDGKSPLFLAMKRAPDIVRDFVIIGGVDVNARTTTEPVDSFPLTLAVLFKQQHLIAPLIELGADVNQVESCSSMTALYHAIVQDDYFAAETLLENGALPNQRCAQGRTPLHAAIETGNTAVIRLLVQKYKVDINGVVTGEETGACALHVAAFLDSANATFELLQLGADILQVDSQGRNALDIAKNRPTSPVLHILLEHQSSRMNIL